MNVDFSRPSAALQATPPRIASRESAKSGQITPAADTYTASTPDNAAQIIREQRVTLKPGHEAATLALLEDSAVRASSEPGAVAYRLFENIDNPADVLLLEQWQDRASWQTHMQQPYLQVFVPRDTDAYSRVPVTLTEFAQEAEGAEHRPDAPKSDALGHVIKEQRIEVKPGVDVKGLETALTSLAKATRREPGNVAYRLFEEKPATDDSTEPTRIVLLEEWANQQMLDRHRSAAPLTEFFKTYGSQFNRTPVSWQEIKANPVRPDTAPS